MKLGTGYQQDSISDPVCCWLPKDKDIPADGPGWYFWNETWTDLHGPFDSKQQCENALFNYCKTL